MQQHKQHKPLADRRDVEDFLSAWAKDNKHRKWLAMTGVSQDVFRYILAKYCKRAKSDQDNKSTNITAIHTPYALFQVLVFLKCYPVSDALPAMLGELTLNAAFLLHRCKERIRWLAERLDELRPHECDELPGGLFPGVFGSVDGLPVYVQVPTDLVRAKQLRSGKYHTTVIKYDVVVNHRGLPLAFYGPFDVRRHSRESQSSPWKQSKFVLIVVLYFCSAAGSGNYARCRDVEDPRQSAATGPQALGRPRLCWS